MKPAFFFGGAYSALHGRAASPCSFFCPPPPPPPPPEYIEGGDAGILPNGDVWRQRPLGDAPRRWLVAHRLLGLFKRHPVVIPLDATEPRLELEVGTADQAEAANLMAVDTS